jgi:predicted dehydrogenase
MALDLTQSQKETGRANFQRVADGLTRNEVTRRDFIKSMALTGAAVVPLSAAAYFGYEQFLKDKPSPVKTALIGAGDEGGVLIGEHPPELLEIVAVCDIRPTQQERIFIGDYDVVVDPNTKVGKIEKKTSSPRKGLNHFYGENSKNKIKVYTDYKEVLGRDDIEAVIIALPLFLHAPIAIAAMKAGKHVLCEKLMAWNVAQSKEMARVARAEKRVLSIGHQRHYSMLYAHALDVMNSGVLGDVRHIRALWHRNNVLPYDESKKKRHQTNAMTRWAKDVPQPTLKDSWYKPVTEMDYAALKDEVKKYGFKNVPELIRWRLYGETGGGLMAELGGHQLDACSIFLGKVHPLTVSGVGGKYFYHDDRDIDDHIFCTFEFPGANYENDKEDKVVLTYSSINTNDFEPYGECVMGSDGTLIVEGEKMAMLYARGGRDLAVSVSTAGKEPALDSSGSATGAVIAKSQAAIGQVSRGYREEMEHFAYCIRMREQKNEKDWPRPRCDGDVALADAVMALAANAAMANREHITFEKEWFDADSETLPEWDKKVSAHRKT